jgi:hypothetical protein
MLPGTLAQAIARILIEDWDPIGVNDVAECQDEYDRYVPAVLALVQGGASTQAIAEHLVEVEHKEMGGRSKVTPALLMVADKVRSAGLAGTAARPPTPPGTRGAGR